MDHPGVLVICIRWVFSPVQFEAWTSNDDLGKDSKHRGHSFIIPENNNKKRSHKSDQLF